MAPKRSSPLDDPPSASSSSSTSSSEAESEEINDHEKKEQNKGIAESEGEESGDEEEEEVENKTSPVQTPTPTATPQRQSSSGSEGSDSEDSGGTQTSPTASDFAVKPIVSKPMDDSTKHKKPTSKSPTPASKSGAKRPAESEEKRKESQKKRKIANGEEKDGVVEEKKSAINRLWSEDDEIVVLKGMIDYQKKKGPISHADMGAFLEFIKKSLHVDVSKNQLVDKVRRLKKKYWSGAEKGEEPVFSKPHDIKCWELSKKIWGGGSCNAVVDSVKSNSKKAKKSVKVSNSQPSPKEEEQQLALQKGLNGEVKEGLNGEVKDMKVEEEDFCSLYPHLQESLGSERYSNLSEAGKNFIKGSISMIGSVKAKELEEKWKKFREDEVALYLQQIELIQEQTKLIFEAMKSSNS